MSRKVLINISLFILLVLFVYNCKEKKAVSKTEDKKQTSKPQETKSEELSISFKGLSLKGKLLLAKGKSLSDGVILMTHGTLGHYNMETVKQIQELLVKKNFNTLAINLSLSESNRTGMYDCKSTHKHRHDDAAKEISAWVNWLKNKSVKNIVLFGHSRGGNQTLWYLQNNESPLISKLILLAPPVLEDDVEKEYKKNHGNLDKTLKQAEDLVKSGKGDTILKDVDFLYCKKTNVSADSFVSYYSKNNRQPTTALLKKLNKPTLVIFGSEDKVVPTGIKKIKPLADEKKIQFITIDGADHFFRDTFAEDVADNIAKFLK